MIFYEVQGRVKLNQNIIESNLAFVLSLQHGHNFFDVDLFGRRKELILQLIEENPLIELDSLLSQHV